MVRPRAHARCAKSRGCWPRAWRPAANLATPPTVLADALESTAPCTYGVKLAKVPRLQAAQAATQRTKRPSACSGLPSGPKRRTPPRLSVARMYKKGRGLLVPYQSRRSYEQSSACRSRSLMPLLASNHCGGACSVALKAPAKTSKPAASTSTRVASLICRTRCGSEA